MKASHIRFSLSFPRILLTSVCLVGVSIQTHFAQIAYTAASPINDSVGAFTPAETEQAVEGGTASGVGSGLINIVEKIPVRMTFSVREGFNDNLFTTRTNRKSSFYTNWGAGLRYDFGSPRLQITTNLSGGLTYYYTRPGAKTDLTGIAQISARYLATERLTLSFQTSTGYYSQPDVSIQGGDLFANSDYFYSNSTLSAAYQWTQKFSTVTGYNIRAFYYADQGINDSQGRIEQTISQSVRYQLLPKWVAVAEYRANPVTYYQADLNSFGNFGLLGFDWIINPRSTWSVRGGVEQRFLNNPVDGTSNYVGPFGESVLGYQFGPRSRIEWLTRYGTEASGLNNVTQRQTFRTGLSLNHGFTPRLFMNLGGTYQVNYYDQPNVIPDYYSNVIDVTASLTYVFTKYFSVTAGYNLTTVVAQDQPDQEYLRNIAFVGLNASF